MTNELPPLAQPGELSVRAKSVELQPGVYITKMRTHPVRIGKSALSGAATVVELVVPEVAEEEN